MHARNTRLHAFDCFCVSNVGGASNTCARSAFAEACAEGFHSNSGPPQSDRVSYEECTQRGFADRANEAASRKMVCNAASRTALSQRVTKDCVQRGCTDRTFAAASLAHACNASPQIELTQRRRSQMHATQPRTSYRRSGVVHKCVQRTRPIRTDAAA